MSVICPPHAFVQELRCGRLAIRENAGFPAAL
jgi:hypothetical protein